MKSSQCTPASVSPPAERIHKPAICSLPGSRKEGECVGRRAGVLSKKGTPQKIHRGEVCGVWEREGQQEPQQSCPYPAQQVSYSSRVPMLMGETGLDMTLDVAQTMTTQQVKALLPSPVLPQPGSPRAPIFFSVSLLGLLHMEGLSKGTFKSDSYEKGVSAMLQRSNMRYGGAGTKRQDTSWVQPTGAMPYNLSPREVSLQPPGKQDRRLSPTSQASL